mgnify:CR=1 FL=1
MLDFKIETFPHNLIENEINLLIIEDNMDDYHMYKDSLENVDYPIKTKWIEDGEDVINYLMDKLDSNHKDLPNIIMIDKNLPGMSGIELLDQIKKVEAFQNILTLMVTGDKWDRFICRKKPTNEYTCD